MFDFKTAVRLAGEYRNAREELGIAIKNELMDNFGLCIDYAMIGLRGQSYLVKDGKVHTVHVTYDWTIEPDYVNLALFDDYEFLTRTYSFRFKVDSLDGQLVVKMKAAHVAWKEAMKSTGQLV